MALMEYGKNGLFAEGWVKLMSFLHSVNSYILCLSNMSLHNLKLRGWLNKLFSFEVMQIWIIND